MISVPQRRLSFDCKTSKPVFCQQSDVIGHITSRDDMEKVQHVAVCFSVVRQTRFWTFTVGIKETREEDMKT